MPAAPARLDGVARVRAVVLDCRAVACKGAVRIAASSPRLAIAARYPARLGLTNAVATVIPLWTAFATAASVGWLAVGDAPKLARGYFAARLTIGTGCNAGRIRPADLTIRPQAGRVAVTLPTHAVVAALAFRAGADTVVLPGGDLGALLAVHRGARRIALALNACTVHAAVAGRAIVRIAALLALPATANLTLRAVGDTVVDSLGNLRAVLAIFRRARRVAIARSAIPVHAAFALGAALALAAHPAGRTALLPAANLHLFAANGVARQAAAGVVGFTTSSAAAAGVWFLAAQPVSLGAAALPRLAPRLAAALTATHRCLPMVQCLPGGRTHARGLGRRFGRLASQQGRGEVAVGDESWPGVWPDG